MIVAFDENAQKILKQFKIIMQTVKIISNFSDFYDMIPKSQMLAGNKRYEGQIRKRNYISQAFGHGPL